MAHTDAAGPTGILVTRVHRNKAELSKSTGDLFAMDEGKPALNPEEHSIPLNARAL